MTRGPAKKFDPDVALEKAMEVFWAKGYEAASLSELMANMGISKKSLYDTFGNKRSLFLKALEHYSRTVLSDVNRRLSTDGSPLQNIENLLKDFRDMHSQPCSKGCMLGTNIADFDTDDAEIAAVLRGYLKQVESILSRTLRQAQEAGEISEAIAPRDMARFLLVLHQGMALVGRVLDDSALLDSVVSTADRVLEQS